MKLKDPAVTSHHPVALSVGGSVHPHDRCAQGFSTCGAEVTDVTEAEEAAVRGDQPVPTAVGGCRHGDDGLLERQPTGGSVKAESP